MNYTTLEKVKSALGGETNTDDALLEEKIAEASRAIDRLCAAPDNYFELTEVANETGSGLITHDGRIVYLVKKPIVVSVTAVAYRLTPLDAWTDIDPACVSVLNSRQIVAYGVVARQASCQVKVSYEGGYGAEEPATPADPGDPEGDPPVEPTPRVPAIIEGLPADIINAATVLSIRFYKEEKSGLTDAIGVAELGTMQYTKALPARVTEMLRPYKRIL